ncbi:helix-turn-helix domain-containing protein [Roseibium sp. RKSG952]|uniref:winged helix-turn-helix transcriptional regulator n=1 Tax=Roseibium sp. RKSG952 TaxID=2529384 RepID=UPI001FCBD6F6|nr:winged helix-turn-helix transcriptional regulator [Roseibium sp. RKSG952]
MALLDLLGHRWALGILWVLAEGGPCSFNTLQGKCSGISPGVLNTRLKELKLANLVVQSPDGYQVSPLGGELFTLIGPLGNWARESWARSFEPGPNDKQGQ